MQRFTLSIVIAIAALFAGIVIGRYTSSSSEIIRPRSSARFSKETALTNPVDPAAISSTSSRLIRLCVLTRAMCGRQ